MTLTRFTLALSLLLAFCGTAAANYEAQAPVYPPSVWPYIPLVIGDGTIGKKPPGMNLGQRWTSKGDARFESLPAR